MSKTSTTLLEPDRQYHVPALEKALDLLELLADASQVMTLKEAADHLGRNSQELFRVAHCLLTRGYLLRDTSQQLRISTKLFELGSKHSSDQALAARALPHMQRFTEVTNESGQLLIVVRDRLLTIAAAESAANVRFGLRVGALIDLFNSINGLVALAFQPPESWPDLARRRQEFLKERKDIVPVMARARQDWEQQLGTIRAHGYAVADSPVIVGSRVYSAPVLGAGGTLLAVLTMSRLPRLSERPPNDRPYIDALTACAQAISAEFGPQQDLGEAPGDED